MSVQLYKQLAGYMHYNIKVPKNTNKINKSEQYMHD